MVIIGGYLPFLKQTQMKDKDRIKQLEEQLKLAKKRTYIHETYYNVLFGWRITLRI